MFISALQFQVAIHHGGKVKAETSNSYSHYILSQNKKEMDAHLLTCFVCLCLAQFSHSIIELRTHQLGNDVTHTGWAFSYQIDLVKTHP